MSTTRRPSRVIKVVLASAMALTASFVAGAATSAESGCPTWTSGGSLIHCASDGGATELFERAPDGSVRRLTYLGGRVSSPSLSPDETRIVFDVTYDAWPVPQVFTIERFGPRARTVVVGSAVISIPVATGIDRAALVGGTLIRRDPVHASRLTDAGANWNPVFAPSGDRIDFTSDRLGSAAVWSMDLDGGNQRQMLLASNE